AYSQRYAICNQLDLRSNSKPVDAFKLGEARGINMKTLALRPPVGRREVFSATATAMSITPAAVEKDFWLCWVLMQLFEVPALAACLRFKSGTSLSKCFNVIQRFSEDMDLMVDWTHVTKLNPLEPRSKTKQEKINKDINKQTQAFISD